MATDVLHLIACNFVGGPEKQILYHAEDMKNSAYCLSVGSFRDQDMEPEILMIAAQKQIGTLCLGGGPRLRVIRELEMFLRHHSEILLCTHGFKANVVGYVASRRAGVCHIAFVRGWTAETWKVALYEKLERWVLARARWVVCVSAKQAERIGELRFGRSAPIVVPNAIMQPFYRPAQSPAISRKVLGIEDHAFVFGAVGRLSKEKGHRFLLSAFARLRTLLPERTPVRLILIGGGREENRLKRQTANLGLQDGVVFAGYQTNCMEWMRLLDCLVQPSLTEGTPNSVLEALALHLPVIATAVGGVPDVIRDETNGLLVPPADIAELMFAMKRMMCSETLRRTCSIPDPATEDAYSPERQRANLIAVYEAASGDTSVRN